MSSLLVLGGARSGKSRYAERWVEQTPGRLGYIATAQPLDDEMCQRIARHRADRSDRWQTIETPLDLADTIAGLGPEADAVLVDCLTLWLSNLILADRPVPTAELCAAIARCPCPIALVANEVGYGIVPDNALARRFRDEAGRLNQKIAEVTAEVVLVAAGLPLLLKPHS